MIGSSVSPVRLVLFDVDGTLLTCGQRTRPLLGRALTEVFGAVPGIERYDFAGKTDPRIVLDLAAGAGVGADEARAALPRVRDRYLAILERGLPAGSVSALPGVAELLARLTAAGAPALGLLTGNWRRGAEVKLERAGLAGRFRFGAYGDDGLDRDDLPPVALARAAEATGGRFTAADTLIVGDTPHDVACARAHGMRCLAVATGGAPAAALARAGADWVVDDLSSGLGTAPLHAG